MGNRYRDIPDADVQGRAPIDPRRTLRVGDSFKEAIRCDDHVYVHGIDHRLATALVTDFNKQRYPDICRWMQRNKRKLTGDGISLWMGMIDYINGSIAAQASTAHAKKHGRYIVAPPTTAAVAKGVYNLSTLTVDMIQGGKTYAVRNLFDRSVIYYKSNDPSLCSDLVFLLNHADWNKARAFLDAAPDRMTNHGKRLYNEIADEVARRKNANFQPQFSAPPVGRIPADDEVVEEMEAILDTMDTYGIGQPNRKSTAEWEPDVPDPDVDLMKSIRDACTR